MPYQKLFDRPYHVLCSPLKLVSQDLWRENKSQRQTSLSVSDGSHFYQSHDITWIVYQLNLSSWHPGLSIHQVPLFKTNTLKANLEKRIENKQRLRRVHFVAIKHHRWQIANTGNEWELLDSICICCCHSTRVRLSAPYNYGKQCGKAQQLR